jgi:hypothetical protein
MPDFGDRNLQEFIDSLLGQMDLIEKRLANLEQASIIITRVNNDLSITGDLTILDELAHQGTTLGFYNAVPVEQIAYEDPTGTTSRATFATTTVTTAQLAQRVKALIEDFKALGLFG